MNNAFAIADPFDPTVLDEETELSTMARALQFADGFKLLFVRCNQHNQRRRLVDTLRNRLPQFAIQEIRFDAPIIHLLDALRERIMQPSPDAVFVSGLEYSLPTAADAHAMPFVANLNAARNSFPPVVPSPLVLWIPEYILTAIMRGAPDFFSIRSGVYYFAATPRETGDVVESTTASEEWRAANLPFEEKQERIAAIENLLADYRALPSAQRDHYAEVRLLTRLGTLYGVLGRWAEAEECYQQSLALLREVGDRSGEGQVLDSLGAVYNSQGLWTKAEERYQQSLRIRREVGDRVGEGNTLNNLGNVYKNQGRWTEAEVCYQQSLMIRREMGDRVGEGRTIGNLGIFYRHHGQWVEAEAAYQQSLAIKWELGDHAGAGITLNNLGNVYYSRGRWAEAEAAYQQSLAMKRELGDYAGVGTTLHNLGEVYYSQERWVEAEAAYQQSLAMKRELGDRVGEGETLKNFAELQAARGDIAGALEIGHQAITALEVTEEKAELEKVRQLVAEWKAQVKREA